MVSTVLKILIDLAKSPRIVLDKEEALRLLTEYAVLKKSRDLEEAIRIVRNFTEYLGYSRRKFEEYINVPKDPGDALRGRVVVHRIRLFMDGAREMVEIVFDRRINIDELIFILKKMGFTEVVIEEQRI
ncbi:MAG: hypothetical protein ACP5N5_04040 [Desulfurococcus sp.]|uniref:hypothetical protein n=1 Tax=Desulfurococcus sp. TaxID=51678 RepID=UPI003D09C1B6